MVGGCTSLLFAEDVSVALVYVGVIAVGAGNSALMVTSVALEADLIGRNVECGAFVFGALSLTDKLSNGASILVIQQLRGSYGHASTAQFYRWVVSAVPAVCATAALAMILLAPLPTIHMKCHGDTPSSTSALRGGGKLMA